MIEVTVGQLKKNLSIFSDEQVLSFSWDAGQLVDPQQWREAAALLGNALEVMDMLREDRWSRTEKMLVEAIMAIPGAPMFEGAQG